MPIDWNIVDDAPPPAPAPPSDALDGRRVHAIVLERRAAHRARLRARLVPIACAAVAMTALTQAWAMRANHPPRSLACAAIAAGVTWIGVRAARKRPESSRSEKQIDAPTPDFAALPAARSAAERLAELNR